MGKIAQFISVLINSRDQAHILHLQATGVGSFARHSALNGYYDGIVGLFDRYVEVYQGKYQQILKGYTPADRFTEGEGADSALKFFASLEKYVSGAAANLPKDPDLVNIHADILELIHETQYKLTFLS